MCLQKPSAMPGPFVGEGGKNQKKFIQQKLCVSRKAGGGGGSLGLVKPSTIRRQAGILDRGGGGDAYRAAKKWKVFLRLACNFNCVDKSSTLYKEHDF